MNVGTGFARSRPGIVVLAVLTALLSGSGTAQEPREIPDFEEGADMTSFWRRSRNCGPNSLYVLATAQGYDVSYEKLCDVANAGKDGCSLDDLRRAAKACGIPIRIGKTTAQALEESPEPLILHFDGSQAENKTIGHFVVLVGWEGDKARIMDGTSGVYRVPARERVLRKWSGYVISVPAPWSFAELGWALAGGLLGFAALRLLRRRASSTAPRGGTPATAAAVALIACVVLSGPASAQQSPDDPGSAHAVLDSHLIVVSCPHVPRAEAEDLSSRPDHPGCDRGCVLTRAVVAGPHWRVIEARRGATSLSYYDVRWFDRKLVIRDGRAPYDVYCRDWGLQEWGESAEAFDDDTLDSVGVRAPNTLADLRPAVDPATRWSFVPRGGAVVGARFERSFGDRWLSVVELERAEADRLIRPNLVPGDSVMDWRAGDVEGAHDGYLEYKIDSDHRDMVANYPRREEPLLALERLIAVVGGAVAGMWIAVVGRSRGVAA